MKWDTQKQCWKIYGIPIRLKNRLQTKEEKKITDMLVACEEKLHERLTEEQVEELEKYKDCLDEMGNIAERNAFVKGVRFAAVFLIEALYGH